jgi:DNA-damage-inducible protein D
MSNEITPFEQIRRTNPAGNEFWSSRDFARVLGYADYRNFQAVIESARTACFNSGQRVDDHFVEVTEMVEIGSGAQRSLKTAMLSRYACYLVIQNADPTKKIVAQGKTYFAVQTRRQELSDEEMEEQRRLTIRGELRQHASITASSPMQRRVRASLSRETTPSFRIMATWASTVVSVPKISIVAKA